MSSDPHSQGAGQGLFRLDREAETSPRRLALLIGGGAALVLVTLWMVSGGEEQAAPAPVIEAPAPAPPPAAPAPAPPAQPQASASQLTLYGVTGLGENGAAIIGVSSGAQRLVRTGRDVLPGLTLVSVAADHVILRERGQDVRLGFPEAGGTSPVSAAPAPEASASPPGTPAGARRGRPDAEAMRRETIEYQRGLVRRREEGQRLGYQVRRGEVPAAFASAGLRPGDVVLRIGGTDLESADDIERIPLELHGGDRIAIEFIRDGRRQTAFFSPR